MRDDAGKLIGFEKVTRDFTERLQTQEALRQEITERQEAQRSPAQSHRRQLNRSISATKSSASRPNLSLLRELQLSKAEDQYALDDLCDTASTVAAGNGEFVHAGWLHSYSSAGGGGGCADSCDSRTQPDLREGPL